MLTKINQHYLLNFKYYRYICYKKSTIIRQYFRPNHKKYNHEITGNASCSVDLYIVAFSWVRFFSEFSFVCIKRF